MSKHPNIVHQYFRKKFPDGVVIYVKVNPFHLTGIELTRFPDGSQEVRELEFDDEIFDDLEADAFEPCNALEFNLYYTGLA
ncbi:MAG: hypothetical protein N2044_10825 [Cyclobacteriaceae bacterium]|nr:hypothetical protein [Cyclobacteriaceae bacterium]MCX7638324.1 hypothetical protein [Cyclobacteriaceae bacterium]MDW8331890.1 hypothetical protein [Cyclobacteriaceae bacterium]